MNLGYILTEAWRIVWKHKLLWLLGILSSCATGNSEFNNLLNAAQANPDYQAPPQIRAWVQNVTLHPENFIGLFLTAGAVLCLLWALMLVIDAASVLAGMRGALNAADGAEHLALGELLTQIRPQLGSVIVLWLVSAFGAGLFGLALGLGLGFSIVTVGLGLICLLPLLCLSLPLFFIFSVVTNFALVAMLDEGHGLIQGLERGWSVFRAHWGDALGLWASMLGIGLLVGMLLSLPAFLALLPALLPGELLPASIDAFWLALACTVAYLPALIAGRGLLAAYGETAWVLAYRELSAPNFTTEEGNTSQPA